MKYLTTYLWLPPGRPSPTVAREFFRRVFEEYRWFIPTRSDVGPIADPSRVDYDALLARYNEGLSVMVLARTDQDFFHLAPALGDAPPFVGKMSWDTSLASARKAEWRDAHLQQLRELMKLFGSPLAQSGSSEDFEGKCNRLVPNPDGFGSTLEFTVRDPGEGLPGLFWRNFFGPPFVRMFGDRLASVPATQRRELEDGIVLVEPYELPAQALTAEGMALEQQLIAQLGPECFYDHVRQRKPSRVPQLSTTPD